MAASPPAPPLPTGSCGRAGPDRRSDRLREMKITDVTLTLFAWKDIPATSYGRHTGRFSGSSDLGLLTLRTDDGLEGHAFLGSAMRPASMDGQSLIRYLKPLVLGQDPLERERLWQSLWQRNRSTTIRAIGAVDVALWDLGGKAANLPIHRLLGSYRTSAPAYASSAVLPSKEAYAEEAMRFKTDGWTAYKIHPPTDPVVDIQVCQAVRRAVGDGYTVMLDSTWAYQYPEALRVGKAVEALGFHWYEDPLADDDLEGYVKLKQVLSIPILATEYTPGGFTAYAPWLTARATDYLRGDPAVKGGITPLVKAAHLAEGFHMNFEIHHGGNSLNNVANLHVIMAIKNCEFFEVLLPAGAQKYGLAQDIDPDAQGLVHAPTGPGLGAAIDFDLIRRTTTAVLT
jgi:L-alanine-DL-glutamate epimerase-like enolase superfamily enzyme